MTEANEIKQILGEVRSRNELLIQERIKYYELKGDIIYAFDEKIKLAMIGVLFAEIDLQLKINQL